MPSDSECQVQYPNDVDNNDDHNYVNDNTDYEVRFEVLKAVRTKMAVFWVAAPCSLVEVYQRFRGTCCLHHQGDLQIYILLNAIFACEIFLSDAVLYFLRKLINIVN
jgi:hypothetical protein